MIGADSDWLVMVKAGGLSQSSSCGISGRESDGVTNLSPSAMGFTLSV